MRTNDILLLKLAVDKMDPRTMFTIYVMLASCVVVLGELYNVIDSNEFDQLKGSRELVVISFIRCKYSYICSE